MSLCSVVKHAYCFTRDGTVSRSHSITDSSWFTAFGTNTDHMVSPSVFTRLQNGLTLSHASCRPFSSVRIRSIGLSRCTSSPSASLPLFMRTHFSFTVSMRSLNWPSTRSASSTSMLPSSGFCSSHCCSTSLIALFSLLSSARTFFFSCSCDALIASWRRFTICSRHDQSFSIC